MTPICEGTFQIWQFWMALWDKMFNFEYNIALLALKIIALKKMTPICEATFQIWQFGMGLWYVGLWLLIIRWWRRGAVWSVSWLWEVSWLRLVSGLWCVCAWSCKGGKVCCCWWGIYVVPFGVKFSLVLLPGNFLLYLQGLWLCLWGMRCNHLGSGIGHLGWDKGLVRSRCYVCCHGALSVGSF